MLLFIAGVGATLLALGVWWIISRVVAILHVLRAHAERLDALTTAAEDTSAGVDQLTADLGDLTRRALALDPQYVYGQEEGQEEAPD